MWINDHTRFQLRPTADMNVGLPNTCKTILDQESNNQFFFVCKVHTYGFSFCDTCHKQPFRH